MNRNEPKSSHAAICFFVLISRKGLSPTRIENMRHPSAFLIKKEATFDDRLAKFQI